MPIMCCTCRARFAPRSQTNGNLSLAYRSLRAARATPRLRALLTLAAACLGADLGAQTRWAQRFPAVSPPARRYAAAGYDENSGLLLIHGGIAANGVHFNDTWGFDGSTGTWTRFQPNNQPTYEGAAMAYDRARGGLIMFGGYDHAAQRNSAATWRWTGSNWQPLSPATSPPGRHAHAMVYLPFSQRVMLFGGYGDSPLGDTWLWDGSTWTQATQTTATPSPRWGAKLACDGYHVRLSSGAQSGNDWWVWESPDPKWKLAAEATPPSPRHFLGMTHDTARAAFVVFSGYQSNAEVHERLMTENVRDWQTRTIDGAQPSARFGHVFVYDPRRQVTVLFGGGDAASGGHFADTWEYGAEVQSSLTTSGSPCSSSQGTVTLTSFSQPWAGHPMTAEMFWHNPFSVPFLMVGLNPLQACLPMRGSCCALQLDPIVTLPLAWSNSWATGTLMLPRYRTLWGQTVRLQGGILQPGINDLGLLLTNRLDAVVGTR